MTQRELKFRVWDNGRKEWVHGPGNEVNLFGQTIVSGEILRRPDDTSVSLDELNDLVALQYSGLTDKHGKEIYEHDIMALKDASGKTKYLYVVKFEDAKFVLHHLNNDYGVWGNLHRAFEYDFRDYEFCVVGNIYTTPELVDPKMIER